MEIFNMLNNLKGYNNIKIAIRKRQLKAIVEINLIYLIKTSALKISIIFDTYVIINIGETICIWPRATSEVKDTA